MPIINSEYRCHPMFRSGHIQTLLQRLFRSRPAFRPEPQTLATPDGDELELFVHRKPNQRELVIFTHGLESHAKEASLLGFAETVASWGYDTINWSMRSCGKRLNRTRWFYLGHDYRDLQTLVDTYSSDYDRIYLVSVSLGGTITANYLGREGANISSVVKGAFLLSPPLELNSFHAAMARPLNHFLYQRHVVRSLLGKFERKAEVMDFGEGVDVSRVRRSKSVDEIEDSLFAPMHGFDSSVAYRKHASALPHLNSVAVPTYILSAKDDPFVDTKQLPFELAEKSPHIYLELAKHGGHTGFLKRKSDNLHWYEHRFRWFISQATA